MSKKVSYVVVVDIDEKVAYVDDQAFVSKFSLNEGTYDTTTKEWTETEWDDHIKALMILSRGVGK